LEFFFKKSVNTWVIQGQEEFENAKRVESLLKEIIIEHFSNLEKNKNIQVLVGQKSLSNNHADGGVYL
jgi:hypothetical protein